MECKVSHDVYQTIQIVTRGGMVWRLLVQFYRLRTHRVIIPFRYLFVYIFPYKFYLTSRVVLDGPESDIDDVIP